MRAMPWQPMESETDGPDREEVPMTALPIKPKCAARRTNGQPCGNYPMHGGTVCRKHGGGAPQVRKKAAERIREAADDAAAYLVRWMADETVDKRLRVSIAQDLLDRAGISKTQTVGVELRRFERMLDAGELVVDLPAIEGEVVEEPDDRDNDFIVKVDGPTPGPRRKKRRTRRSP